jgi:hypothetical protein
MDSFARGGDHFGDHTRDGAACTFHPVAAPNDEDVAVRLVATGPRRGRRDSSVGNAEFTS